MTFVILLALGRSLAQPRIRAGSGLQADGFINGYHWCVLRLYAGLDLPPQGPRVQRVAVRSAARCIGAARPRVASYGIPRRQSILTRAPYGHVDAERTP